MSCYVPLCESTSDKRGKCLEKGEKRKISFHQFPSKNELRLKWIFAIGRIDPKTGAYWDPPKNAVVCCLHFSPKQFKSANHLIAGSIPFIFPGHDLPERGNLINQADLSSMKLIPFPSTVNSEKSSQKDKSVKSALKSCEYSNTDGIDRTNQMKRTFAEMNSSETDNIDGLNDHLSSGMINIPEGPNIDLAEEVCTTLVTDSSLEINFGATGGDTNTGALHTKNVTKSIAKKPSKTHKRPKSPPLPPLYPIRKQNEIFSKEIQTLREENKTLKVKIRALNQILKAFNVEELNNGVMKSNAKALFIYDQLRSFAEGKCILSKSTLNFVEVLKQNFPECYLFLTEKDIISLPPLSDLNTNKEEIK